MEPGSAQASREKPWATVWWRDITGCGFRVYATFWPTEQAALAHKQVDPSAIVVNVSRAQEHKEHETRKAVQWQ
jgi:hypothetical protein